MSGISARQGEWKGEYFLDLTTRGVTPPQWPHGRDMYHTPHLRCLTWADAVQISARILWSAALSVLVQLLQGCVWEIPGEGTAKELTRCPFLALGSSWAGGLGGHALCSAAGSSSLVLAGVLLSLAEPGPGGGGALYWKQHLSIETYYLALLTQGHCKSFLIFFSSTRLLAAEVCTPLHITQCERS